MNLIYKWTNYIIYKLEIIIWYYINLFTNLQNPISSLYKYLSQKKKKSI